MLQHQAVLLLCPCLQLSLAAVQAVVQGAAHLLRMLMAGVLVALALRAEVALLGLLLVELTPLVEGVAGTRCLAGADLSHLRGLGRMATVGSRSAAPAAADTRCSRSQRSPKGRRLRCPNTVHALRSKRRSLAGQRPQPSSQALQPSGLRAPCICMEAVGYGQHTVTHAVGANNQALAIVLQHMQLLWLTAQMHQARLSVRYPASARWPAAVGLTARAAWSCSRSLRLCKVLAVLRPAVRARGEHLGEGPW